MISEKALSLLTEILLVTLLYYILYMYKFLKDVNFADDPNLGFPLFYFRGSFCYHTLCFKYITTVL